MKRGNGYVLLGLLAAMLMVLGVAGYTVPVQAQDTPARFHIQRTDTLSYGFVHVIKNTRGPYTAGQCIAVWTSENDQKFDPRSIAAVSLGPVVCE